MPKLVLVTGANRGLGFAVLSVAGAREPSTTFILCCRDIEAGINAKSRLRQEGVAATIDVLQLDVTNDDQIMTAVKYVAEKYGKLDVLVNNAGIISIIPDYSLPTLRRCCNEMCSVNIVSVAVVSTAFARLLQKAPKPRVVNITSGLGSIHNTLTQQISLNRLPATHHTAGLYPKTKSDGYINYYSVAPGLLKTALTNFKDTGLDPKFGAEVIVELIADDETKYEGGSQLEFKNGVMKTIPW
ncbi:short chain dehydrogenase/reductase family protein [Hypoxylon rubiginosum]|uniref:Short chain dehydrogenase/reductase family protein n=1 Tax=Hypoxylon rubiginosum TaxID=110542 RepID=A0ACB9YUD6_9PEZI|nr:short chain dehydrogenase/reductase family protein [Hypoxylon rubiginosum]